MLRLPTSLFALLLAVGLTSPASALLLDFYEDLEHGEIAVDGSALFEGYSVTVVNPNRAFDLAVAFDSNQNETTDPDIEYGWQKGWSAGNLAPPDPTTPSRDGIGRLGNVLILQENFDGCGDGICDDPDDEGSYPVAGGYRFDLDDFFTMFAIDLIDLGDHPDEEGRITFYNGDAVVADFRIDLLPSLLPDQDIVFGNHTANRIELSDLLIGGAFNAFTIDIQGSGAIDTILVNGAPIPEPATAALLVLGLSSLAVGGRRRRR